MEYFLIIETLNQLNQYFSQPSIYYFNTQEEAEAEFAMRELDLLQQGFQPLYIKKNNNKIFVEKRYSNNYFTVTLILDAKNE